MKKIAFVYTSMGGLVETTRKLAAERLPGVETVHIADSGLVGDIIRAGEIPPPCCGGCVPVWKRRRGCGCHRMRLLQRRRNHGDGRYAPGRAGDSYRPGHDRRGGGQL